ncbi:MAG: sigma-54-dependent Fis family transcriptional regulator [Candidatus Riflebacteria bacterium]|nr:sigma-54-dependent Fis family transcriptional regulator [Candidatus Riflebacteria bacterium]
MRRVLVVDDEAPLRDVLIRSLSGPEFSVSGVGTAAQALALVSEESFDVAVLDIRLPDMDGVDLLRQLKEVSPGTEAIMLTADATLEKGLQAMRLGAYDYLTKPAHLRALQELCLKAAEKSEIRRRVTLLEREVSYRSGQPTLIGSGAAMSRVREMIRQVAPSGGAILITGESGTGKELVARAIHDLSPRAAGAFIAVNCGAFQESLLESELFGHKKGAFTGALFDKPGLFDVADGGTLFLDEVGEMTLPMQVKLLRVLDTRRFRPIGDTKERSVDFRIVAATNRELRRMVSERTFREDLYYRLNVVSIEMPPLRGRLEDLPELVEHLIVRKVGVRQRRRASADLLAAFQTYSWPGNVRELENQIERSILLSQGPELQAIAFPPPGPQSALQAEPSVAPPVAPAALLAPPAPGAGAPMTLEEQEKLLILSTLERLSGNVSRSAQALGIDRRTLHRKLKSYGVRTRDEG